MQQVIRRRVVVESNGRIQFRAAGLREGTMAEVLVIVEADATGVGRGDPSELRESIAAYAVKYAGTEADFDPALESAAVEFLTDVQKGSHR